MRDVDYIRDVGEGNIVITLHEHDLLRAGFENVGQTGLKRIPGRIFLVDLNSRLLPGPTVEQLHDDGAIRILVLRRIWRWRLRHQGIEALWRQRRNNHENDQQHQKYVNQRGDVDVSVLTAPVFRCHSHNKSPIALRLLPVVAGPADSWS